MRRRREETEAPGQESFLDVVANLVGIMIILIMVVGARAKDALIDAEQEAATPAPVDVDTPQQAATAVRSDLDKMLAQLQTHQFEVAYRRAERDKILALLTTAEHALSERQNQLDAATQAELDQRTRLAAVARELEDLRRSKAAVDNSVPPPEVLAHYPTPLAKTVFGKEVHFQLSAGRVTHVPLEELVDRFKAEAPQKVWKLKETPQITEVVGPIGGFRLKYTLIRKTETVRTPSGSAVQQRPELDHFDLVPVSDQLGEDVESALAASSDFRRVLGGYEPNRTTVTIWVYPDSFRDLRRIKEAIRPLGFLTASRPLPEGQLISGSPQGSRSAAE